MAKGYFYVVGSPVSKERIVEGYWQAPGAGGASNTGRCMDTSAVVAAELESQTARLVSEIPPEGGVGLNLEVGRITNTSMCGDTSAAVKAAPESRATRHGSKMARRGSRKSPK